MNLKRLVNNVIYLCLQRFFGDNFCVQILFLLDHLHRATFDRNYNLRTKQVCDKFTLNNIITIADGLVDVIAFNPSTDNPVSCATKFSKFAILVHFLYIVYDAKRSAGELLAG
jgi:hypothetical protein